MIRALLLIFGLALGLALALLAEGRMAHLRAIASDRLPAWTKFISPDTRFWHGQTTPLPGPVNLAAEWRLARLDRAGPVWQLQLAAPGLSLSGAVRLGTDGRMSLEQLQGPVNVAALEIWETPPALSGVLQITRADAAFDPDTGMLARLQTEGYAADVMLDQTPFGEGRFASQLDSGGRWQLSLTLPDSQAEVEVEGDTLGGILRAHVPQDRADALPPGWGNPLPLGDDRVMVSYLLPLIVGDSR
ncbi:MAG: hypothetical protein JJU15_06280 [Pararhodobacter sp.]|nr:hypothetical protein [Pararhodobacter sp.]